MTAPAGHGSLYAALALYARAYARPVAEEELVRGLPVPPDGSPPPLLGAGGLVDNFDRAARRAGYATTLARRRLADIPALALPAILVMNDGGGCVLDSVSPDRATCRILLPETGDAPRAVAAARLEEQYAGLVFYVGPAPEGEGEGGAPTLAAEAGHWFWSALRHSRSLYADVLAASLVINLFVLASPLFTMNVYDRVVPNDATDTLWVLATGVAVVFALDALLKFLRTYFVELAAKKSDVILSARLFEKVLDLRMEEAPRNIGSFASNFKEFDTIRGFLTSSVLLVLVDLPFTLLFLGVIWLLGGPLVLVPLAAMALSLLYALAVRRPLFRSVEAGFEAATKKSGVLIEMLAGLRDLKYLNAAGVFQWKWETVTAELADRGIRTRLLSMSISTVTGVLIQLATVAEVIVGVYLIKEQALTLGGLIAVIILSSRSIAPMGQVVGLLSNWEQARLAFSTLDGIMAKPSENPPGREFIRKSTFEGALECRGVTFAYPGSERPVIEGLSFSIRPGERVGLLGRTGSGKSTVQKLILGLYRPQAGSVLVDGLDVTQIAPVPLRRNIAWVPQEFSLFSGTIRENILSRAPRSDDAALVAAARAGGLEAFIRSHPRGFDARVEERGANLSGGQRQGIAIARAFLAPAPVALLDEPTNGMDGSTEEAVKAALRQATAGRTLLLVTHKPGLLDLVDRVLVLEAGRLAFDGPRDEFLRKFLKGGKA